MELYLGNNTYLNEQNRIAIISFEETGNMEEEIKLGTAKMKVLKENLCANKGINQITIYTDLHKRKGRYLIKYHHKTNYVTTTKLKELASTPEVKLLINFEYSPKLREIVEQSPNTYLVQFMCHSKELPIYINT